MARLAGVVNPARGHGVRAHAVADEYYDVPRNILVQSKQKRLSQFLAGRISPVIRVWSKKKIIKHLFFRLFTVADPGSKLIDSPSIASVVRQLLNNASASVDTANLRAIMTADYRPAGCQSSTDDSSLDDREKDILVCYYLVT